MRTPLAWNPPTTPFSLAQVAHLGVNDKRIDTALRNGQIVRLRRGVYVRAAAVPEDPAALHRLRAEAVQIVVPDRVASHETAALALGLPLRWTGHAAAADPVFTMPRDSRRRSGPTSGSRVRLADLPDHHLQRLPSGLLVTTAARTAVDLAATLPLPEALMAVDAVLRQEPEGLVGRLDRSHYRDARLITAATAPLLEAAEFLPPGRRERVTAVLAVADAGHESPLESFSAGRFYLAGFPTPRVQARVMTAAGEMFGDLAWDEEGVIGEADGEGKYADASAFAREKEREHLIRDEGWTVVRWTGREAFGTPDVVDARVARALMAGGWSPG